MPAPADVDEYLAGVPGATRPLLDLLLATVRSVMPDATEAISYQMIAFRQAGRIVVWCAAFRDHVSLFPASDRVRSELGDDLGPHLTGKGTIRFDAKRAFSGELVRRVVLVRLAENAEARVRRAALPGD